MTNVRKIAEFYGTENLDVRSGKLIGVRIGISLAEDCWVILA